MLGTNTASLSGHKIRILPSHSGLGKSTWEQKHECDVVSIPQSDNELETDPLAELIMSPPPELFPYPGYIQRSILPPQAQTLMSAVET